MSDENQMWKLGFVEQIAEHVDIYRHMQAKIKEDRLFMENLILRLACHQIEHGPVTYNRNDPMWDRVRFLLKEGRIGIGFGGGDGGPDTGVIAITLDGKDLVKL